MTNDTRALEAVSCRHEDMLLQGQLAVPTGQGPHPGVLVVHTAFGLGGHISVIVARLAEQGYVALAVDMYGGGAYSEEPEIIAELVKPLWGNAPRLRSRMAAWMAVLGARGDVAANRIAAIGYCFGGQCVLEAARAGADLRVAVSFHGILTTNLPAPPGAIRAQVAVFTGGLDPHVPSEHVDALRAELLAAGADWQITGFGNAYHAFTDPSADEPDRGRAYNALADELSWASTMNLLSAIMGK